MTQKGSGGVPAAKDYLDSVVGGVAESVQDYPDLIVINHGTNDGLATSAVFIEAYRDYLKRLNIKMPGVPVFVMVPFKGTHSADFEQIIDGFNNVTLIKSDTWNISSPNTGHPDADNSTIAGQRLAEELLNNMGSGYFK
jgi:dihydroorotate dehydrogenase